MFERTLQDVVKGLRAQPTSEGRSEFASQVLQECKKEMSSTDGAIKSNAVLKVAHLRMLGYDDRNFGDDNTSFHVIETMALQPFKQKRIGYLAASQLLTIDSPLLLLATNSLKKELQSSEVYAVGLALGSISNFASKGLARDLLPDVVSVATTALRPYARKRGTLCLYRLCTRYPEGLREGAYDALRSRLDDSDSAVVSCAVNAVCELAKANPRNVLPLTPQLYQLLTTSGNNWLTIKVVKLYSSLLNVEPRLAKKLLDPLAHIIKTTGAKSLLYECISTITQTLKHVVIADADGHKKIEQIVNLCAAKLKEFIRDSDQNLKYLGLVGFVELTKSFPAVAQEHKDLVLLTLNDEDVTVRLRALELLAGMANKHTVAGIVSRLLEHLAKAPPGKFRDAVVQTCIDACVDDEFQRIPSCEWLVAVLMDLARLGKGAHGPLLAKHIVNVAMKVQSVRKFASNSCARLLFSTEIRGDIAPEVLAACAFVACEYFDFDGNKGEEEVITVVTEENGESSRGDKEGEKISVSKLVETLLAPDDVADQSVPVVSDDGSPAPSQPSSVSRPKPAQKREIPADVRCVFILNAFKLAIKGGCEDTVRIHSEKWLSSQFFQVRDRARWCRSFLEIGNKEFLNTASGEVLGPIHPSAQRKVPLPPGLDLSVRKAKKDDGEASQQTSSQSRYTSTFISFRGQQQQHIQTRPSPYSASIGELPAYKSKTSSSGHESVNTYSMFKLSPTDTSAFMLGKSKKRSSKKKHSKDSSSEEEQLGGPAEDEDADAVEEPKPKEVLWSSRLTSPSPSAGGDTSSGGPSSSSQIVMAPSALPPGALLTEEDDMDLKPAKKQGAPLTLADVDILDDAPDVSRSTKVEIGGEDLGSKKDKKKKSKDEKKHKKKKSKKKDEEEEEETGGGVNGGEGAKTAPPTAAEGDLLDFSEF